MIPTALAAQESYAHPKMPVAIVTGAQDRLMSPDAQSERRYKELGQSRFERVAGAGTWSTTQRQNG